jgi:hypothetical protein
MNEKWRENSDARPAAVSKVVGRTAASVRGGERQTNSVRTLGMESVMRGGKQLLAAALLMTVAGAAGAQPTNTQAAQKIPTIAEQFASSNNRPPLLQGQNAAQAYVAAWDSISPDQRGTLHSRQGEDERQVSMLVEQQAYVGKIINAAMMDECDWGLDYKGGLELLLPHLGLMRGSARMLIADASRLMAIEAQGETRAANEREAVRRVKAAMRMSEHVRHDRILISGLVGAAMNSLTCSWVEDRLRSGTLSTDSAQQVLGTMRPMNTEDVFGLRDSVMGEWEIFDLWFKEKFQGERGAKELADFMPMVSGDGLQPTDEVIRKMDRNQLDAAVARLKDFYVDSAAIWDQPKAHDELLRLATAVTSGEYGVVAQRMAPSLVKAWSADKKGQGTFEATKKMLEAYIQNDGKMPAEMQKPAAEGDVR